MVHSDMGDAPGVPLPPPPGPRPAGSAAFSIILLVANLGLLAFLCGYSVPSLARYRDLFAAMGADLPGLTMRVLSVPSSVYWAASATVGALLVAKEVLIGDRVARAAINAMAAVLLGGLILLFHAAVRLPMLHLIESIQR